MQRPCRRELVDAGGQLVAGPCRFSKGACNPCPGAPGALDASQTALGGTLARTLLPPGDMRDPYSTTAAPFPYVRWGVLAGVSGAALIAVFFLVVDWLAGRPLATPNALGATLFLGEPFDLDRAVRPALVVGYTAVHGGVFVGLASIAAALGFGRPSRPPGPVRSAPVLAALLFAGAALLGLGFRFHAGVSLWNELGTTQVAIANALAALGMAAVLGHGLRTRWRPPAADAHLAEPTDPSHRRTTSAPPGDAQRSGAPAIDTRQQQSPHAGRMDPTRS